MRTFFLTFNSTLIPKVNLEPFATLLTFLSWNDVFMSKSKWKSEACYGLRWQPINDVLRLWPLAIQRENVLLYCNVLLLDYDWQEEKMLWYSTSLYKSTVNPSASSCVKYVSVLCCTGPSMAILVDTQPIERLRVGPEMQPWVPVFTVTLTVNSRLATICCN